MIASAHPRFMRQALGLARRGYGATSPNPMVGALLVKAGRVVGRGWHHRAGEAHAEIEALRDACRRGVTPRGSTLYVTLEPCSSFGRTPPCTSAIVEAGIVKVVCGATDPNPNHSGKGFTLLEQAGVGVDRGILEEDCVRLNEAFNHWIVRRTPFVIVKAAMTLDGKIASALGQSKWITGPEARARAMELRRGVDGILVGINTVLQDDPSLTARQFAFGRQTLRAGFFRPRFQRSFPWAWPAPVRGGAQSWISKSPRRIVLDALARTPVKAKLVSDSHREWTVVVVSERAPRRRVAALAERVRVVVAPLLDQAQDGPDAKLPSRGGAGRGPLLDLPWLLRRLGSEEMTSLLVEGGGEVNASFLLSGLAQRIAFFYAPKVLGGWNSRRGVAGGGAQTLCQALHLAGVEWHALGKDLLLTARLA